MLLNTISRNWRGKETYSRKNMKLKKGRIETIETLEITETQTKLTRSGISLKNFTPTCFLYDKDDNDK